MYVFSYKFYGRFIILLNLLLGRRVYYSPVFKNKNSIKFVNTSNYTKLIEESRKLVFNYFKSKESNFKDNKLKLLNYVLKYYDLNFTSFYVFVQSIKKNNSKISSKNIIADNVLKNIYYNHHNKKISVNLFKIFSYIIIFFKFIFFFIKTIFICLITSPSKKINHPQLLYLRKKDYADFVFLTLQKYLKLKNLKAECFVINFSISNKKNNFHHLNHLKSSVTLSIKSFFLTFMEFIKLFSLFIKIDVNSKFVYEFLYSSYISFIISQINSQVITGILLDKPIFSLVYKNKKNQILCSLNEAFMFKPFRYFDYCDLDIYFYMNEIDKKNINNYGGHIKNFYQIPFFRKNLLKQNYKGLSQELQNTLSKFDKKIVFAPSMASTIHFKPTSVEIIERAIEEFNKIILHDKKILIIIKEKKGELENINQKLKKLIFNSKNFYTIRSFKPKLLQYNQFEEIIPNCDLLVTLTSTSTTVLQSLDNNIPFICLNDNHPFSFYKKYSNCEVRLKYFKEAVYYWLKLENNDLQNLLNKIKEDLNICKENGLNSAASVLDELLKKNKDFFNERN